MNANSYNAANWRIFHHKGTKNTKLDPKKAPIHFYTKDAKVTKIDPR